jgi:hypothetical protein
MGCATWRPSQRISVTYRNTKINMYLVVEVSPCMALLPLRTSCWPDVAKSTINLETIQVGMENRQWRRTNQLLMYQKKHVGKATCFASEDPISQQVARFRCPYEYPQKFSICWLVSIYLVAPSFSTAMFSWLLHCKKKVCLSVDIVISTSFVFPWLHWQMPMVFGLETQWMVQRKVQK